MGKKRNIYYGQSILTRGKDKVSGEFVDMNGKKYYKISNYDKMPPFLMSIVSSSDLWMFISSNGGLTCGRKDSSNALFPYYTDDKIHDGAATTGAKSTFIIDKNGKSYLWEPFQAETPGVYDITRNIYKNTAGNILIFEEINHSFKLGFQYAWMNSDKYGFVRHSGICNLDNGSVVGVIILDGLQNILPYGIDQKLQSNMSTLVDGYKKCELHEETGLGIYTLSSILTDKAEPSEALKATTVWSVGMENPRHLLSLDQLDSIIEGSVPATETTLKGRRGAYFVYSVFDLKAGEKKDWLTVADVSQGPSDVPATIQWLGKKWALKEMILRDVERETELLGDLVSKADGNQLTADDLATSRHFSNTLFNIMRGGTFLHEYLVETSDFIQFARSWNAVLVKKLDKFFQYMPGQINHPELTKKARSHGDHDLIRLVYEYLPITFSRRHGDPSRPWNTFSIDVKNEDGSPKLYYEGNWRDIFQNWEALAFSYPEFIESFIAKFVNASTPDGFNPYRVTREGIDWEVYDPDDPWSNIGYWGDHQIIYLLRLIELSHKYHPGKLQDMFRENLFAYSNVPYRIKPYDELIADPHHSIVYDHELDKNIEVKVKAIGSDGKLVHTAAGKVLKVNLAEKILVSLLAKLSNFVPEGGIWMNTQRPEWNDANNALAGNGLSMVTLYHLRRFIGKTVELFGSMQGSIEISEEVYQMLQSLHKIFTENKTLLSGKINDGERRNMVDSLGLAGSAYRWKLYTQGFSERKQHLDIGEWIGFLRLSLEYLNHSIAANKREDRLYHSYNFVEFGRNSCRVAHLYQMLEGQVAVLSSGYLDAKESLEVLDALHESTMYRKDQNSYTLYPDRDLPGFLEKNIIPPEKLDQSTDLLERLTRGKFNIVEVDGTGQIHFNGSLRNVSNLKERLEQIQDISAEEKDRICQVFIDCFKHKQFTGRSGSFYKYEGLGSIYWHMVSKLLLAVQECYFKAVEQKQDTVSVSRLRVQYHQIKDGLGLGKPPEIYGAFPTDPYSHTPGFAGVQQPGMTGQVKEDFLTRFGELGVSVINGCICVSQGLISRDEFLDSEYEWNIHGRILRLSKGEMGFTVCGTPFILSTGNSNSIDIHLSTGQNIQLKNTLIINERLSSMVFKRTGDIKCIRVEIQGNYR